MEETFVTQSASDSTQSLSATRVDQPPPYSSLAAPFMSRLQSPPDYLDIMQVEQQQHSAMDIATIFGAARETDVL
jgi:hypothetical protein